jgi:hypothetical protein
METKGEMNNFNLSAKAKKRRHNSAISTDTKLFKIMVNNK